MQTVAVDVCSLDGVQCAETSQQEVINLVLEPNFENDLTLIDTE